MSTLAGEIDSKGVEFAAAVRPIEGLKLWGNVAVTMRATRISTCSPATRLRTSPRSSSMPGRPIVSSTLAMAGRDRRLGAPCRTPLPVRGRPHHDGAYTTADVYAFVDIPGSDFGRPEHQGHARRIPRAQLTNRIYAAWSDPGYQDQFYLGAPRTFEVATSFKW